MPGWIARLVLAAAVGTALAGCGTPLGFVYVVAASSEVREILAFAIVDDSGAVEPVSGSPFPTGRGALDVAVSPSGRLAFVSNQGRGGRDGGIAVYGVESRSGRLRAAAPLAVPEGTVQRLAMDPGGRVVYAFGSIGFDAVVFGYRVDDSAERLTPLSEAPALARGGIAGAVVRVHPSGRFLYLVALNGIRTYDISSATGDLTEIVGSPFAVGARSGSAVVAPSGRFLYVGTMRTDRGAPSGLAAYAIDEATGALAAVPGSPWPTGSELAPPWLAIAPSGRFLYASNTQAAMVTVHKIDPYTGALSPAPVATHFNGDDPRAFPRWLAVDPSGRFLYVSAISSIVSPIPHGSLLVYRLDPATGALTPALRVYLADKIPAGVAVVGRGR